MEPLEGSFESTLFTKMREFCCPLWLVKLPGERYRYRVLVVHKDKLYDISGSLASLCKLSYDGGRDALNLSRAGDPLGDLVYHVEKKFGYAPEVMVV